MTDGILHMFDGLPVLPRIPCFTFSCMALRLEGCTRTLTPAWVSSLTCRGASGALLSQGLMSSRRIATVTVLWWSYRRCTERPLGVPRHRWRRSLNMAVSFLLRTKTCSHTLPTSQKHLDYYTHTELWFMGFPKENTFSVKWPDESESIEVMYASGRALPKQNKKQKTQKSTVFPKLGSDSVLWHLLKTSNDLKNFEVTNVICIQHKKHAMQIYYQSCVRFEQNSHW